MGERTYDGIKSMGEMMDKYKSKFSPPEKKDGFTKTGKQRTPRAVLPWQQLAVEIIKDFKDEKHKMFYFSVCKKYDEAYIRRVWANTNEMCKHANRGAYFAKMLKVYNDQNKGIYTEFKEQPKWKKK